MLEVVEKLLVLQDCDRRIRRVRGELSDIGPQRAFLKQKTASAQTALESAKHTVKQCEADRKNLELEVESKKEQIARYANQQLQTRKNDEYRALANEIESRKKEITEIEDREIELMERGELAQKQAQAATQALADANKLMQDQLSKLDDREAELNQELQALLAKRDGCCGAVDEGARARYERLIRSKGENVIVGIQHGVCGGCHMRVPAQVLVTCQAQQELVSCTNCGRILYYSQDMDMAVAD